MIYSTSRKASGYGNRREKRTEDITEWERDQFFCRINANSTERFTDSNITQNGNNGDEGYGDSQFWDHIVESHWNGFISNHFESLERRNFEAGQSTFHFSSQNKRFIVMLKAKESHEAWRNDN